MSSKPMRFLHSRRCLADQWCLLILASASIAFISGCSKGPHLTAVEGTVRLHGKPLPGVMVCFVPDANAGTIGPRSTGWADERGRYELLCDKPELPGAVVGKHHVVIFDPDAFQDVPSIADRSDPAAKAARAQPSMKKPKRVQFAVKYTLPAQTPLVVEVAVSGPQTIDLDIE